MKICFIVLVTIAQDERLEILRALSRQLSLHDDVDLKHFAECCEHFTGADFKGKAKYLYTINVDAKDAFFKEINKQLINS